MKGVFAGVLGASIVVAVLALSGVIEFDMPGKSKKQKAAETFRDLIITEDSNIKNSRKCDELLDERHSWMREELKRLQELEEKGQLYDTFSTNIIDSNTRWLEHTTTNYEQLVDANCIEEAAMPIMFTTEEELQLAARHAQFALKNMQESFKEINGTLNSIPNSDYAESAMNPESKSSVSPNKPVMSFEDWYEDEMQVRLDLHTSNYEDHYLIPLPGTGDFCLKQIKSPKISKENITPGSDQYEYSCGEYAMILAMLGFTSSTTTKGGNIPFDSRINEKTPEQYKQMYLDKKNEYNNYISG